MSCTESGRSSGDRGPRHVTGLESQRRERTSERAWEGAAGGSLDRLDDPSNVDPFAEGRQVLTRDSCDERSPLEQPHGAAHLQRLAERGGRVREYDTYLATLAVMR